MTKADGTSDSPKLETLTYEEKLFLSLAIRWLCLTQQEECIRVAKAVTLKLGLAKFLRDLF